jgi:hypothetical protein
MALIFTALYCICALVTLVSFVFILIAAFKDEIWKGLLCLVCQIYTVYYIVTEWDNVYVGNIPVGLVWIVAVIAGIVFRGLAHFAR